MTTEVLAAMTDFLHQEPEWTDLMLSPKEVHALYEWADTFDWPAHYPDVPMTPSRVYCAGTMWRDNAVLPRYGEAPAALTDPDASWYPGRAYADVNGGIAISQGGGASGQLNTWEQNAPLLVGSNAPGVRVSNGAEPTEERSAMSRATP